MPQRTSGQISASERRRAMREHLALHGELDLAEACKLWAASTATVRRDFVELERAGAARREWGRLRPPSGGFAPAGPAMVPFAEREILHVEAKRRIARAAAALLAPGDAVIIDGGTTTLQLVPFVAHQRIKIVTNSIAVAHAIDRQRAGRAGAEVFLTGGQLYPESFLLVGPQAKASLRAYRAKWVFLSAAGLDGDGLTNSNELVVETEQVMIERSERVALLADTSKFGRRAMVPLCPWTQVSLFVTEAPPPPAVWSQVRSASTEVRVAED